MKQNKKEVKSNKTCPPPHSKIMQSFSFKKTQILFFSTYLIVFLLNIISDILYHILDSSELSLKFLYFKLIEIFIFISLVFLLLNFQYLKQFRKMSKNSLDYARVSLTFLILLFYCEFEFLEIITTNNKLNSFDFGFIIGFFLLGSLQSLKNFNFETGFFLLEIIYLAFRFKDFHDLHIQRLLTLVVCLIISNKMKINIEKRFIFKEKKVGIDPKSSFLLEILKELNEEGIAIFDEKKILFLNNEKMSFLIKQPENMNAQEKILKISLKLISIQNNETDFSIFNDFLDFFKEKPENTLESIMDESLFLLERSNPSKNCSFSLKIAFDFVNKSDLNLNFPCEFSNLKLFLTIFIKSNKIQAFLIQIPTILDYSSILNSEKQSQNQKIFFVSHEMRTPMNCIVSMLQILKPLISENLAEDFVTPAIISCNFLLYLVQDLLDMAQMEFNKFAMNFEEFDMRILISDIIELFKIQANSKNVEICSEISNLIPEMILSDHRRIRQILINLIGNALKFMKKINGKVIIEITLKPECASHIIIAVKDNGIGIKDEDKDKLFQAFGKINNEENRKMNSSGVGLGLLISNNLAINLHPNKSEGLQLESKYGFGTSFSFEIEDKNEVSNVREYMFSSNLNENYQRLLSSGEGLRFLETKLKSDDAVKIFPEEEIGSDSKQTHCSMKVNLSKKLSSQFYQLTPLLKKSAISAKEHNEMVFMKKKSSKTRKGTYKAPSVQSFCDVFICKKDSDGYEASEMKMMISKERNELKSCNCPDILICDDNAFNIYSLRKQLESFSFNIDSSNDGDEALKKIEENYEKNQNCCKNYQLIFMDIEMPGKNGYETSREIRRYYKEINETYYVKIIACSAHLHEEVHDLHKKYGMDEFVSKPIVKEKLVLLLAKELKIINENNNFNE